MRQFKSQIIFLTVLITTLFCFLVVSSADVSKNATLLIVNQTSAKVLVNGVLTSFEAYTINGNNYFKLRDIAKVVNGTEKQFEVTWDGVKKAINLISNKPYTPLGGELVVGDGKQKQAIPNTSSIYKDGNIVQLTAYTINGNNFFKLRDLALTFNIGVTWDGAISTVGIDTTKIYEVPIVVIKTVPFANGDLYVGEISADAANGQGTMNYADGRIFAGEWKDGKRNGLGILTYPDGVTISGVWKNDIRNGKQIQTTKDGKQLTSYALFSDETALITITWENGTKYVGEFKDDHKNGTGVLTWSNGEKYAGTFVNGMFNGSGTFTGAYGGIYVGEFLNDEWSGLGTYTWPNGEKYVGEYLNGLENGLGTHSYLDGTTATGIWKDGVMTSELGSMQNPIPAVNNLTLPFQPYSFYAEKKIAINVSKAISGNEANEIVIAENMFNKTPANNQEWRLLFFDLTYVSGQSNDSLQASDLIYMTNLFRTSGSSMPIYEIATLGDLYEPYSVFNVVLYPGGSSQVVIGLLVDKSESAPLLRILYNGGNQIKWILTKPN
jgi:hypothetical protein